MQGLDPSTDIYSAMEPTTSQYINNIWYEINDVDEWKKMMARVDQGLPPTEEDIVDEGSNTVLATTGNGDASAVADAAQAAKQQNAVLVLNGNGTPSAGSVAAERIEALGYEVTSDNADHFDYEQTLVVYDDEGRVADAQAVADALGAGELVLNDGTYDTDGGFVVILGSDW